jgi:hypothetical protein
VFSTTRRGRDCTIADTERLDAIAGGEFHETRELQLRHLERLVALLSADEPDPELERMVHEEDWEGVRRRYRHTLMSISGDRAGA